MDGLLFNTELIYFDCYRQTAREMGLDFPFELFAACVGISREEAAKFMKQHFGQHTDTDAIDARTFALVDEYIERGGDIPFQPGAREAVEFFARRGLKLGLASSNLRKWAEFYLTKNGIIQYFSAITTSEEVVRLKPDPEVYLKTAAKLGADEKECLVFEDSPAGSTAAIRAGMRTCMVPQIKQPDSFIRDHAFKIYTSLENIFADIDELLA